MLSRCAPMISQECIDRSSCWHLLKNLRDHAEGRRYQWSQFTGFFPPLDQLPSVSLLPERLDDYFKSAGAVINLSTYIAYTSPIRGHRMPCMSMYLIFMVSFRLSSLHRRCWPAEVPIQDPHMRSPPRCPGAPTLCSGWCSISGNPSIGFDHGMLRIHVLTCSQLKIHGSDMFPTLQQDIFHLTRLVANGPMYFHNGNINVCQLYLYLRLLLHSHR